MRLQNIILTGLINERLIAYEKLERVMNTTEDIDKTSKKIKSLLKKITTLSGMISEWQVIIEANDSLQLGEGLKKEENG
jgi:hypothetical protein